MQLKAIEKNDQRVLTTPQLALVYGSDVKTISYNFNYNKKRFVEGKHYFVLSGDERKEFLLNNREIHDSSKHAKVIYLWTAKGALLLAKTLGTDEAWTAYEQLVDDYFNKVERLQNMNVPSAIPTTIEGILELAVLNMKDMRIQIERVEAENKKLQLVIDNEIILTKHQRAEIQQAVNRRQGELNREGYTHAHFHGIYTTLKSHFNVPNYSEIKRTDFEKALKIIAGWYPKRNEENQEGK